LLVAVAEELVMLLEEAAVAVLVVF